MAAVVDVGQGTGPQLSLSLRPGTVAAEAMEGVVWMVVKGFEPPRAIFFSVGFSIIFFWLSLTPFGPPN